jgi:hypothetical protein
METDKNFNKLFWFIVGLCIFGAILTIFLIAYLPSAESVRIADTALIFWLSTAVAGGIGYLLGGTATKVKNSNDVETKIDTTETIVTTTMEEPKKDDDK